MKTQDDFMEKNRAKKLKEIQKEWGQSMKPIFKQLTGTYYAMRQDCDRLLKLHDTLLAEMQVTKEKYL